MLLGFTHIHCFDPFAKFSTRVTFFHGNLILLGGTPNPTFFHGSFGFKLGSVEVKLVVALMEGEEEAGEEPGQAEVDFPVSDRV